MSTSTHYQNLIDTLDTVDTKYMAKYHRLPLKDSITRAGLNTYKKIWAVIHNTPLPYNDDIQYVRYVDALERHHDRFLQCWFNYQEIPNDPLSIGQMIVLCNTSRGHFESFSESAKKYIVKELIESIKTDANELNKLYALQLFNKCLPQIRKYPSLVKITDRAFRSTKQSVEHTGTISGHTDFLSSVISKYMPATHTTWAIYQAISSTDLTAMDMRDWISMHRMANININAKENVELPELGLEDFSF